MQNLNEAPKTLKSEFVEEKIKSESKIYTKVKIKPKQKWKLNLNLFKKKLYKNESYTWKMFKKLHKGES